MNKTLILGIGNSLLTDEGVGIYALERLRPLLGEQTDVELLDGGTLSFTLSGPIEEADNLIVIDAAELHGAPGEVRQFNGESMDEFLNSHNKRSVHEVGLIDLLAIAHLTETLPKRRMLIGIQPDQVGWGMEPTPAVAAALDEVCNLTLEAISQWHH